MNLQPTLNHSIVKLRPLEPEDFEELYVVASDPEIWIQHPNPLRYQKEVFQNFFDHAIKSNGALLIQEQSTDKVIGCSRYYDFDELNNSLFIGYTFFGKEFWGSKFNYCTKYLMLENIFPSVEKVYFHIGQHNIRSQKSIERLGAKFVRQLEVTYAGEQPKQNFEYLIDYLSWPEIRQNLLSYFG